MTWWSRYRALSCLEEARLALESDGRGPGTVWFFCLDGSLTWRSKVGGGGSCSGECMSDCLLQLLPSQEHGGKGLLPTDVLTLQRLLLISTSMLCNSSCNIKYYRKHFSICLPSIS